MDMVTSDGRLTPPFHPLTWVNLAARAEAGITKPRVANNNRRALREFVLIFWEAPRLVRKRHSGDRLASAIAGRTFESRGSLPTQSFLPQNSRTESRSRRQRR